MRILWILTNFAKTITGGSQGFIQDFELRVGKTERLQGGSSVQKHACLLERSGGGHPQENFELLDSVRLLLMQSGTIFP